MEECAIGGKRGEVGLGRAAADTVVGCGPWRGEPWSSKLVRAVQYCVLGDATRVILLGVAKEEEWGCRCGRHCNRQARG